MSGDEIVNLLGETTPENAAAHGINHINHAHDGATPPLHRPIIVSDTAIVADELSANIVQPVTATPSSAYTAATPAMTMTTRSSAMTALATATQLGSAGFETLNHNAGVRISAAHSPSTGNVDFGNDDNDAIVNNSGISGGIKSPPAANYGGIDSVDGNARIADDHSLATASTASAPVAPPYMQGTPAADLTSISRGGSSRQLPFMAPRKRSPSSTAYRRSDYAPPFMPLRVQCTSDPVIAALEPGFAVHLAQEAPTGVQRVRFSPESLWDYMCYCFGYGPNPARGPRAKSERRTALTYYELRSDDDIGGGGGGDYIPATSSTSKDQSWSGNLEPGGTGTLWIKARGGAPARPVVATDDIVATVMGIHRELGHADARSTIEAVVGTYFGVKRRDVQWVVDRCPDCGGSDGHDATIAGTKRKRA
jgi:hypothetical protein